MRPLTHSLAHSFIQSAIVRPSFLPSPFLPSFLPSIQLRHSRSIALPSVRPCHTSTGERNGLTRARNARAPPTCMRWGGKGSPSRWRDKLHFPRCLRPAPANTTTPFLLRTPNCPWEVGAHDSTQDRGLYNFCKNAEERPRLTALIPHSATALLLYPACVSRAACHLPRCFYVSTLEAEERRAPAVLLL